MFGDLSLDFINSFFKPLPAACCFFCSDLRFGDDTLFFFWDDKGRPYSQPTCCGNTKDYIHVFIIARLSNQVNVSYCSNSLRYRSYKSTPAATDTLRLSILPHVGIETTESHCSVSRCAIPLPSLPMMMHVFAGNFVFCSVSPPASAPYTQKPAFFNN